MQPQQCVVCVWRPASSERCFVEESRRRLNGMESERLWEALSGSPRGCAGSAGSSVSSQALKVTLSAYFLCSSAGSSSRSTPGRRCGLWSRFLLETVDYSPPPLHPSGMTFNSKSDSRSVGVIYSAAGRLEDGKRGKQSAAEDTVRPFDAVTHCNGRQVRSGCK